jgi:hypothetical protein
MNYKTGIEEFIKELYARFPLKTPKFFQVFQLIGILATIAGAIPDLLHWLEIIPTPLYSKLLTKLLEACGGITWMMAKLPVEHATRTALTTDKMPYTLAAKQEELNKPNEQATPL